MKQVLASELMDAEKVFLATYEKEEGSPERLRTALLCALERFAAKRAEKWRPKRTMWRPPDHSLPSKGMNVIDAVCADRNITKAQLLGTDRTRYLTDCRFIACGLLRLQGLSYPEIGREMGRDHSSAIHAVRRATEDASLAAVVARLRDGVGARVVVAPAAERWPRRAGGHVAHLTEGRRPRWISP